MNQDLPGNPPNPPPDPPPAAPQPAAPQPTTPPPYGPPAPPAPLTETEARTWAMVAHLSVLLNLVTGFLGVVAALVIFLIFRNRSRYVAFQSLESFVFQLIFWAGGGLAIALIWGVTGALSTILIGILCVPFALVITAALALMPVVALVYGVYGGLQANAGKDFSYWLIGGWVRNILPA